MSPFNRGLVPPATEPRRRERQLVLVQVMDSEGFWTNVREGLSVKQAVIAAEQCAREYGVPVRVVVGAKREVIREFSS